MTIQTHHIPLLKEIQVKTAPMPLYYAMWGSVITPALGIRQALSDPRFSIQLYTGQYESVRRGVLRIHGQVSDTFLLDPVRNGAEEWINQLVSVINLSIRGSQPISHLQLCRTTKPKFLAYYAPFYANYMEFVLYIGSCRKRDGATVISLPRSSVDESTRDWKRLAEQLPLDIWIKEVST